MSSDKLRPHHLERKAVLYVRQSGGRSGHSGVFAIAVRRSSTNSSSWQTAPRASPAPLLRRSLILAGIGLSPISVVRGP
jgi:hypothetical protein